MTPALQRAIKMRQWVRRLLDSEPGVSLLLFDLCRKADAAYMRLSRKEFAAYIAWARSSDATPPTPAKEP